MRSTNIILPALSAGAALTVFALERLWPARLPVGDSRRGVRNLFLGALCSSVIQVLEKPLCAALGRRAVARRSGLTQRLPAPPLARDAAAFLLLDYSMYLWHVLAHKVPALWRLHLVHHVDLQLTASTALRFHMADMVVSLPWRAEQVRVIGASPRAFAVWQGFFFASVLFHHSNIRLPRRVEDILERVLTTPRMHALHHRAERRLTDSNWSSGISWWDRLHGTYSRPEPLRRIRIGVPAYPEAVTTAQLLRLPFGRQRDDWEIESPVAGEAQA